MVSLKRIKYRKIGHIPHNVTRDGTVPIEYFDIFWRSRLLGLHLNCNVHHASLVYMSMFFKYDYIIHLSQMLSSGTCRV